MSIEAFEGLIEIQGLLERKAKHLTAIEEENLRISHIDKIHLKRTTELQDMTNQLTQLKEVLVIDDLKISEINKNLTKMKEDFYSLKNEKEIETFKNRENLLIEDKNKLEEKLFNNLEKEEELQTQIQEIKNFLDGILNTKKEIQDEVNAITSKEMTLAEGYQSRIDALVAELPRVALTNFTASIKKYPIKFLSFVETFRCGVCRYEIERNTVALIDRAQVFELCGSCGRLLAPKHLPARL